jgi:hypothetical protein
VALGTGNLQHALSNRSSSSNHDSIVVRIEMANASVFEVQEGTSFSSLTIELGDMAKQGAIGCQEFTN